MTRVMRLLSVLLVPLFVVAGCDSVSPAATPRTVSPSVNPSFLTPTAARPTSTSIPSSKKSYSAAPAMTIDLSKTYLANMETDAGMVRIELNAQKAPRTVNNFVFLARDGFYDGVLFHRVIPGFMAQGGDPTGTGSGGPGYTFRDEISDLRNVAGAISMANAGPDTNGSQFFILYADAGWLDGLHAVFGKVTEGMDIVRKFQPTEPSGAAPATKLIRVTIQEQ